jgi:light-regulated signal transduction histidine kinase (bacteriophytochrome)
MDATDSFFVFIFFILFCEDLFLHFPLMFSFFHKSATKTRNNTRISKTIRVCLVQIFCSNLNRLFDKFRDLKRKNIQHKTSRYNFYLSFRYMERLIWIKEFGAILTSKYRLV